MIKFIIGSAGSGKTTFINENYKDYYYLTFTNQLLQSVNFKEKSTIDSFICSYLKVSIDNAYKLIFSNKFIENKTFKFKNIIIDEAQDLSNYHLKFFLKILKLHYNIIFIYDIKQVIYQSDFFNFIIHFRNNKKLFNKLHYNYRCESLILSNLIKKLDDTVIFKNSLKDFPFIVKTDFKNFEKLYNLKNYNIISRYNYKGFMTIHKAKGLTFENVIIIYHTSEHDKYLDYINELRIFYVAITRARKGCIIIINSNYMKNLINRL